MKAVFLDRDGVVNELIYHQEQGIIDSPFTVEQFRLLPGVGEAITRLRTMGYKVVLVSNQPGMAKGHLTRQDFEQIRIKMSEELAREGAFLDGEYYCRHHPEARIAKLRKNCECRKPKPGLILQAASELSLNLSRSWMIGDGLTDVKAGKSAGTRTILLGQMKCKLCHLMEEDGARPDAILPGIAEAAQFIVEREGK
jgi:D-glycero-D-manno-heptose 1,7-bisphosphate phosphatase